MSGSSARDSGVRERQRAQTIVADLLTEASYFPLFFWSTINRISSKSTDPIVKSVKK